MTTPRQYRRLPGSSGILVRNSLWMGADHLLRVRRNPFSESYRRYYFTDVQAIVVTELPNLAEANGYAAAVLFLLTAAALLYIRHPVWGCFCGLVALLLFFATRRSANCACYIQTSISVDPLPSLRRHRESVTTVALLKTEIEKVQGCVNPEMLISYLPQTRPARVSPLLPALRHCGGQVHWIAFALMLVRGVIELIAFRRTAASFPLGIVSSAAGSILLLLLILATIQQRRSDLALGIRRLIHGALAFYVASGLVSFVAGVQIAFRSGQRLTRVTNVMDVPTLRASALVDLIGFSAMGCAGLILMWRHQSALRTPPPLVLGDKE